ncbi:glycosyl transferase group 1 [Pseudodesulfovibrio mercurii]|uniref:Glycosyl transferase group 1 n=1 Tax=Pseudodesulfovibrio mercurii TaxID=641491 RepID=F0JIQ7_9BACT|nr:glycosyltransferase family 4 protein [Pseudodesulfovibrio mercurii]EGB15491.1 glycosyl transferase group 1 [Pseudodesulfovibrio mercurii]
MKIALCTPFKALDNPSVSGDVTIARDLRDALAGLGHEVVPVPFFPAKEIWKRPARWLPAYRAMGRMTEAARGCDAWLTYGSYYKAPDIFGPVCTARLAIPYAIFQASYALNRGRKLATWPGFRLNRRAMLRADHIFCNRANDLCGCGRLLPPERFSPVRPGLPAGLFARDDTAGTRLRRAWGAEHARVVLSAAMMRAGVKAEGLRWVFRACADLVRQGRDVVLAVAGDGPCRPELEAEARALLGERVHFLGLVERRELGGFFAAGDLFAFPGLKESVGMVYLEAQRCGLPVVATDDEGAPMVVAHGRTGLITGANIEDFTRGVDELVRDPERCAALAAEAPGYVTNEHDAQRNYGHVADVLRHLAEARARQS